MTAINYRVGFYCPQSSMGFSFFPQDSHIYCLQYYPRLWDFIRLKWEQCYSTDTNSNKMVRHGKQDKPKHLLFGKATQGNLLFQNYKSPCNFDWQTHSSLNIIFILFLKYECLSTCN